MADQAPLESRSFSVGKSDAPALRQAVAQAQRIFAGEAKSGCRDRLVIGGLSGFARRLPGKLREAGADAVLLARVEAASRTLADYEKLDSDRRREAVESMLGALDGRASVSSALAAATRTPSASAPAPITARPPVSPPQRTSPRPPARPRLAPVARAGEEAPFFEPTPAGLNLDSPLTDVKGIGPQKARLYARLELRTVRDLVFHFPARHSVFPPPSRIADLFFQSEGSVVGLLERIEVEPLPRNLKKLKALIRDESGTIQATWLRAGKPWLGIRAGETIAVSGKLLQFGRQLTFDNPEFERGDAPPLHTRGLVPVYPLTAGLFDKEVRSRIHWAVSSFARSVPDPLPASVRAEHGLLPVAEALRALHFPRTLDEYEAARRRFAFEELLSIQIVVLRRRQQWQAGGAPVLSRHEDALTALVSGLPFELTGAQRRVVDEILVDTAEPRPMTRLVQGEVGSGKTAVAALALVNAVAHGYQGALMAPTEILAEQHFGSLSNLFEAAADGLERTIGRRLRTVLLTGSVKGKARDAAYDAISAGDVDVVVGTQALIQEKVGFDRLGLVVVDEQHRFGVKQRITLRRKGEEQAQTPHLLVMTATPIPRTLALSQYGDLDLSVIDEMPPGRQTVKTVLLGPEDRHLAYERIRRAVARGQQAFVICPLVEESEVLEARAATEEYERLRTGELSGQRLALLHGRMKPAEKEAVMRAFRDREFDVLVSTAVVEVGVDIPNATVMLIEGAERFGLAQLHQFRGRVGRGSEASVCILLSELADPAANERLRVVERSSNGLELAEHDLRLRGPGDYFGVRQSGMPEIKVARLDDALLLNAARSTAARLLAADPDFEQPEHADLNAHLAGFIARMGEPS